MKEQLLFLNRQIMPDASQEITLVGDWTAMDFAARQTIPLLLPYCAKAVDCLYRYREGCSRCGQCDIDAAYAIAARYGLQPVTIQNYEMLAATLEQLKRQGCQGFIGTCCRRFWLKHDADFTRLGVPGILINVENCTCYDLGKEQAAYQGRFNKQTRLKTGLLELVAATVLQPDRRFCV